MYSLLTRVGHVPVRLEEGSDVERLAPPDGAVHRPVERELQRPAVQGPGTNRSTSASDRSHCGSQGRVQGRLLAGHDEDRDGRSRVACFLAEAGGELLGRAR